MNRPSHANTQLTGAFEPIGSLATLEARWRALEARCEGSFFVSWSWIGPWLRLVEKHSDLRVYECRDGGEPIALGIVSDGIVHRRKLFRSRTISINEVGHHNLNMFIEYNGLLACTGYESRALQQLIDDTAATDSKWDELQISNIRQDIWGTLKTGHLAAQLVPDIEHTTWIAPLDQATDLEAMFGRMSSNRRSKIRRSFKEYEKEGPLSIHAASSADEALAYFRRMGLLHTQRWNRVGVDGSFSEPNWIAFHEDLIASAFPRGEVQLLRILCGTREIGYVYNFLWRNTVLMLQSGFASESSNLLRPGYVSHMLAMQLNARNGATQYDFLVGDSEYKGVLAEALSPLVSGRVQRRRIKFALENAAVDMYRRTRRRRVGQPSTSPASKV